MIKSKKIRNVVAKTIGGLMATAVVLAAAPVNARAEDTDTIEGCVGSGVSISLGTFNSSDVELTFSDDDNCGFTYEKTGWSGMTFGSWGVVNISYKLTFPKIGNHTVTAYKDGVAVNTSNFAITDHTYDAGVITTQPTCVNDEVKTYTCTVCGDTYTEVLPETGVHEYGDWIKTTAPTVFKCGVNTRTCTVCGMKETKRISKIKPRASFEKRKYTVKKKRTIKPVLKFAKGDSVKGYKAKNKKIVKVYKNGKIKGLKKGKTKVTVTMKSGVRASYTVVVK